MGKWRHECSFIIFSFPLCLLQELVTFNPFLSVNFTIEKNLFCLFQINRGLIIYICFLKGATETMLEKMGKYTNFIDHMLEKILFDVY